MTNICKPCFNWHNRKVKNINCKDCGLDERKRVKNFNELRNVGML